MFGLDRLPVTFDKIIQNALTDRLIADRHGGKVQSFHDRPDDHRGRQDHVGPLGIHLGNRRSFFKRRIRKKFLDRHNILIGEAGEVDLRNGSAGFHPVHDFRQVADHA